METPQKNLHSVPPVPSNTRINLALARTRVKRWLEAVGTLPMFKDKPQNIPRAIYISIKDIEEMKEDCAKKYPHDTIEGIRIYFGLAGETEPVTGDLTDLRGMIVPVLKVPKKTGGKDAIHRNPQDPDPNDTNIYDVTAPCPKVCDTNSELYVQ